MTHREGIISEFQSKGIAVVYLSERSLTLKRIDLESLQLFLGTSEKHYLYSNEI